MKTDANSPAERQAKPKTATQRTWVTGRAAFKLMAQYQSAADPKSYAVWYEYAARKNTDLVTSLDRLIAQDRGVSTAVLRQLYETHIAEHRDTEQKLAGISQAIQSEVAGAKTLVTDVIANTNEYVSSMDRAKTLIPNASSPEKIVEALDELIEDTRMNQEAAETIQVALESTHQEITQLNTRVGELRENLSRDALTSLVKQHTFERLLAERSAEAFANGYSLTVMVVCVKNLQDLSFSAGIDISEFVLKTLTGFLSKAVGKEGICGRLEGPELAVMLPRAAYSEASKIAKAVIKELDQFKIVKKPSDELVGYIGCAFGGASLQQGLTPRDLIRIAGDQASQAKVKNRSVVKFDLSNHNALQSG
ncbi:MAG: diguanylate cyclase [Pseudomonadota bacterium]